MSDVISEHHHFLLAHMHVQYSEQLVMFCRCLCAVGIWAETDIGSRIAEQSSDVNDFLKSVSSEMVLSDHSTPVRPL